MNKWDGRLDQDDVAILSIIATFTALSIEQARLFHEATLAEVARLLGDIGYDVKNLRMPVLCGASMLEDEIDEVFAELKSPAPSKSQKSHEMCNEIIEMLSNNARRIQDCVKGLSSPPKFPTCKIFMSWPPSLIR